MQTPLEINYQIKPFWKSVTMIMENVKNLLHTYPQNIVDAVSMTAVELVENAIKYGSQGKNDHLISFNLQIIENTINIAVVNSIESENDCTNVISHIKKIQSSSDTRSLYGNRLRELLKGQSPSSPSRIGLYRIACEGGFSLHYEINKDEISIIAQRKLNN